MYFSLPVMRRDYEVKIFFKKNKDYEVKINLNIFF
jgi:hypothetical protein